MARYRNTSSRQDVPRDGAMHQVALDQRDQDGTAVEQGAIGRHGQTRDGMTVHIPGVTDRDTVARQLHQMIEQMPHPEGEADLCGVPHVEDVGIWQTPYTGREALRRELARLGSLHKRPVLLVHGYQHVGSCPEVSA